jgi:hypothetical protein
VNGPIIKLVTTWAKQIRWNVSEQRVPPVYFPAWNYSIACNQHNKKETPQQREGKEYRTVYPIQGPHQKRALSSCYLPYAILNKHVISSIFRLLMYRLHRLCSIYTNHSLDILMYSLPNQEIFSSIFSPYLQTYGFEWQHIRKDYCVHWSFGNQLFHTQNAAYWILTWTNNDIDTCLLLLELLKVSASCFRIN